jgi:hypothetical protein
MPLRGTQKARDDDLRSLQITHRLGPLQRFTFLRRSPQPSRISPSDGNHDSRRLSTSWQGESTSSKLLFMTLTASQYRAERKARGTQTQIAEALGIRRVTIMRRETARTTVTREAMIALLTLPKKDSTDSTRSA